MRYATRGVYAVRHTSMVRDEETEGGSQRRRVNSGVVNGRPWTIGRTSKIGIWGQSMGAVTALLYANRDPSIAGIVLDSPFSSLNKLMMELVDQFTAGSRMSVPQMATRMALSFMRSVGSTRVSIRSFIRLFIHFISFNTSYEHTHL